MSPTIIEPTHMDNLVAGLRAYEGSKERLAAAERELAIAKTSLATKEETAIKARADFAAAIKTIETHAKRL